ncbi:DUF3397 domain-containing protein [Bacillus testis]|uniref:DUF3397 domain-containing protein n=1 Tax=Bacillus testis TaxID=1622072 RepID=UPI00067F3EEE|nr:DUF3397 domain-containing protein [Bacillus testis]
MGTVFAWIIATLVTVPAIGYLLVFISTKQITKNHRTAVDLAMNSSAFLFILSVYFLVKTIWDISLFWIILLAFILISICIIFLHLKVRKEIIFSKVFKGIWRTNALVFMCAYVVLVIFGVCKNVVALF